MPLGYLISGGWGDGLIRRVDRETKHFWFSDEGEFESRWKRQPGDLLFVTFGEAKAHLVRENALHLERALALEPFMLDVDSAIFLHHPLPGGDPL